MAYLTCPDCRMPSPVEDGAISYRCFSCAADIRFEACHRCSYPQAIPSRWFGTMFQVVGTAATQTCRTAASAGEAEAAMSSNVATTVSAARAR